MNIYEFLNKRNGFATSIEGREKEYILYKYEAKEWIKHKMDNEMVTDGEYLKELLMMSKLEHNSSFLVCDLETGNIYPLGVGNGQRVIC